MGTLALAATTAETFIKTAESTSPQWWLAGMDASDGRPSFPPVALNGTQRPPSCYANGDAVVCISEESRAATAWVIDGGSGKLTHTGPTDLSLYSSKLRPTQVGGYLVAQTEKEGVYGVGPNAEPTWFVPGVGMVASHDAALAFQSRGEGLGGNVFTLADGRIVRPELAPEARLQTVRFFDGGFAAEVAIANDPAVVKLFDTNARVVADTPGNQVAGTTANLIAAFDDDHWAIFTSDGARLLDLPREQAGGVRLIGSTLWVATGGASAHRVQPYDLRTGDRGKPCNVDLSGYLGSDGTVALRASLNPSSDDLAQAYDFTTCGMVWSIPRPAGSVGELVRIGDTLIRLSDDGTELTSLVAPS